MNKRNLNFHKISRILRSPRIRLFLFLLPFVIVAGIIFLFFSQAAPESFQSEQSGIDGAGFQNVIGVDPWHPGVIIAGADVSGFHRSTDYGVTFKTSNKGLAQKSDREIATIAFSNLNRDPWKDVVYAGSGADSAGTGGGFFISTDNGRSWQEQSGSIQFHGGNAGGDTHPRPTGNLLALDEEHDSTHGYIYAATYDSGLKRLNFNPSSGPPTASSTWTNIGLTGKHLRTIVMDPADHNRLYVGTNDTATGEFGAYRIDNASSASPTITGLSGAPDDAAEEMVFVGNSSVGYTLFSVGPTGVYKVTDRVTGNGSTWTKQAGGLPDIGWESITGYMEGTQTVLIVGCVRPGANTCVLRSTNGGASWQSLDTPSKIHNNTGGLSDEEANKWWHAKTQQSAMMPKLSFVAAHIQVDPNDHNRIYVAGRAGVWATNSASLDWYPMVRGMGVTINRAVAVDPNNPGRVYVANTDWVFLASADHAKYNSISQDRPPNPDTDAEKPADSNINTGEALAVEPGTGKVYFAAGERDHNTYGELFSNPNPSIRTTEWTPEGLRMATGNKRPLGVAVGKDAENRTVLVVTVEERGIWRKVVGSGGWINVKPPGGAPGEGFMNHPSSGNTLNGSITWPLGSRYLYAYDKQNGLWRSDNYGVSWVKIWNKTTPSASDTGYVIASSQNPAIAYLSISSGFYRIENASTVGTVSDSLPEVNLGGSPAGPLAVAPNGTVFIATHVDAGHSAGLFRSTDAGSSWQNVADEFYKASAGFPLGLAAGPDNYIYTSTRGNGVIVSHTAACTGDCATIHINDVSPTNGSVSGGTAITIHGTGFAAGSTVKFGGVNATGVTVSGSTTITATTPAHAIGSVDVSVTVGSNTDTLANSYTYTENPSSVHINDVTPTSGSASGGTSITIHGTGFASGATVKLGGVNATNVVVSGTTSITATTPAHDVGAVNLLVTVGSNSDTLPSAYTYTTPSSPHITSITPTSGSESGGTSVTITGTNFSSGATVKFGGTNATNVNVVNSTTITATTPAHAAGAVNLVVTIGSTSDTLANAYTYSHTDTAPHITGLSPTSGSDTGGTSVTITGTNFAAGATVKLGGTNATNVNVVNSTTITAKTPAYPLGGPGPTRNPKVDLTVIVGANSDTLANAYTYTDTTRPTTSVTSPANGATVSGTININADASDNVGVDKVEVYIDGVRSAEPDVAAPYIFSWNTTGKPNGGHTIYVIAYDAANNSKQADTITVTVNNPTPPSNPGDVDGDGDADIFDANIIAKPDNWEHNVATRSRGDIGRQGDGVDPESYLTPDGVVNIYDSSIVNKFWSDR